MARIFISYSHQDEAWKDRLVEQLKVLNDYGLEVWEDRQITAGDDWLPEIQQAIAGCDLALLLVSAAFLTSEFIKGNEVPPLLERRQQQGIRVIPVILSPCQWPRVPWLKPIQARPKDGKPLSGMSDHDVESALSKLVGEIDDLDKRLPPNHPPGHPLPPDKIDLSKLPVGAQHFLGRSEELAWLDHAWASDHTQIAELTAPGGVGKTALVKRWLEELKDDGWRGAARIFAWSFYSQGTSDDKQASEDNFLAAALDWFGVEYDPALSPWDKGRLLAEAVRAERTLLLLDGVEPLQYPPGPLAGQLRAPGLKALLGQLAGAGQPGICLLTSRERITDLIEYEQTPDHPAGAVQRRDLGNLGEHDGAHLLHTLGAKRAGTAPIPPDDPELRQASREVRGHALTLSLLGRYLALAYQGDIRRRGQVAFQEADAEIQGGHAFRVMAAYERWFAQAGEQGGRELAALRLLGIFDRPAAPESLAALREPPAIAGLTEPLVELSPPQWRICLKRLEECGLLYPSDEGTALDAHPLVREYLAQTLRERQPEAWREGHRRIFEQLKASCPHHPEGLDGLQPLYQAVAHGCLAGLYEEARAEVYRDRILRGTGYDGFYSGKKLGAIGADLGAVACLFAEPWSHPAPALTEPDQAWLLSVAAFNLRALGRLDEALEPMRAGAEMGVQQENWGEAARRYSNLSELQLTLGRVTAALADAERAVEHADRSGDEFQRMGNRTALADALHQHGEGEAAAAHFEEAEVLQVQEQPSYPLLYSLQGFRYCDLLLAGAERAAWGRLLTSHSAIASDPGAAQAQPHLERCGEVAERAAQTLNWAKDAQGVSLLDLSLIHLTLARCALLRALLQGEPPPTLYATARTETDRALDGLRAAGRQDYIPRALLTRAWLRHCLDDPAGAADDLAEAQQIAQRGNMRLFLADCHLTRARLFRDPPEQARAELAQARALIEACEYWRRLPELEDAEAALGVGG